ncbi:MULTISPECIES: carboxypeptidase regulatory-like domain-containing protein [unclassified Streptomyces]|uniref:carboxypeptidase regulatory-like domain-containing protein n=1 Tax=unclassified Streptomyces TaxID=2593676 RepID=UPI0036EDCC04
MIRKTVALGVAVLGLLASAGTPAAAADAAELWAAATIAPARQGLVEVTGYTGPALGEGSRLTLTAPRGARITEAPLDAPGHRGTVDADGDSATYTNTGPADGETWREGTFPFVLDVAPDAVPGTRLTGCTARLTDARGTRAAHGTCTVTVGLPEPTLTRPEPRLPPAARPEIAGTAYPGAQVTVRHAHVGDGGVTGQGPEPGAEVCAATARADGAWSCQPALALPGGPGRLQATASLNGVSAVSEQRFVAVGAAGR